jgi:hypothetical protein
MGASATITSIRPSKCGHFIPQKMFAAGTPVPRSTKNLYLVYEIGLLHENLLAAPLRRDRQK